MAQQETITLEDPTEAELKAFSDELQVLMDKHSMYITSAPQLTPEGTIKSVLHVFKKVDSSKSFQTTDGEKNPPTKESK
jgi:hypothetical protein